ncbi:integrase catalytic domain-containing protein [Nephila pilipes]|uniref:Integrase catalytic domain-containing protein n=1 Tax=Nephila pilipes TaxID=299642 RepID=A0A8X6TCP5_NEPPI|nr:integrase catalytic domain-containing protein [Nephila pilipes]
MGSIRPSEEFNTQSIIVAISMNGEAKRLVDARNITADTYTITKDILKSKYGNKDKIIQTHLDYLENITLIKNSSLSALNELYIDCNGRLRVLDALGKNTQLYGIILAPKLLHAFLHNICRNWVISAKRENLAEGYFTKLLKFLAEEVEGAVAKNIIKDLLVSEYSMNSSLGNFNVRSKPVTKNDSQPNLPIEILIGSVFYWNVVNSESPVKLSDSLTLVPSIFGFILSGPQSHATFSFIPTVHNIIVDTSSQALDNEYQTKTEKQHDFFWYEHGDEHDTPDGKLCIEDEIVIYRFTPLPIGHTTSPFLLSASLCELDTMYKQTYPTANKHIRNNTYMDDFVMGSSTDIEPTMLYQEMQQLTSHNSLPLAKWTTNSKILQEMRKQKNVPFKNVMQVLEIKLDTDSDAFQIDVQEKIVRASK